MRVVLQIAMTGQDFGSIVSTARNGSEGSSQGRVALSVRETGQHCVRSCFLALERYYLCSCHCCCGYAYLEHRNATRRLKFPNPSHLPHAADWRSFYHLLQCTQSNNRPQVLKNAQNLMGS